MLLRCGCLWRGELKLIKTTKQLILCCVLYYKVILVVVKHSLIICKAIHRSVDYKLIKSFSSLFTRKMLLNKLVIIIIACKDVVEGIKIGGNICSD